MQVRVRGGNGRNARQSVHDESHLENSRGLTLTTIGSLCSRAMSVLVLIQFDTKGDK